MIRKSPVRIWEHVHFKHGDRELGATPEDALERAKAIAIRTGNVPE